MATLKFLGRGSAFTDDQNTAYFTVGDTLVLIDCSMMAFNKIRKYKLLNGKSKVVVLVTHTHVDHTAGIPMLIDFATYVEKVKAIVICPASITNEIRALVNNIECCDKSAYKIISAEYACIDGMCDMGLGFEFRHILTDHVDNMRGKCFGYYIKIDGQDIVYTGDTRTLVPYTQYLKSGTEFYVEASAYRSGVHLYIGDTLEILNKLTQAGVKIYLMHMALLNLAL